MTQTQHTPGPWVVSDSKAENGRFQIKSFKKYEHAAFVVCETPSWDGKEDKANARLIAAAPELLEALEGAYDEICGLECDGPRALLKTRVEAAIAKARGQE